MTPRPASADVTKGWKRRGWVTGNKNGLKDSARYPGRFYAALAEVAIGGMSDAGRLATRL
eukprot:106411-Pyramimonas_sp.AAC.1